MALDLNVELDKELEDIVPIFMENRKKDILELDQLLANQDFAGLQNIAHKLAGNAGSYGFHQLGKMAVEFEKACEIQNLEEIKSYCEEYKHFVNNVTITFA